MYLGAFGEVLQVLSHARWSARRCAQVLLYQLVSYLALEEDRLVFAIDETLERRWGAQISKRGILPE